MQFNNIVNVGPSIDLGSSAKGIGWAHTNSLNALPMMVNWPQRRPEKFCLWYWMGRYKPLKYVAGVGERAQHRHKKMLQWH